VHIGVGGFNRSHLAVYLDDLLEIGGENRWAEYGVGLLPADRGIHDALAAQDFLYGVLERDVGIENYRVIGSLVGHLYAPQEPEAVIARLAAPECRIISLTVTEGGYFLDDGSREFLAADAAIRRDLENPSQPTTWLGYVAAAVVRRKEQQGAPFTLLSCDNLQANGDTARKALLAFAELRGGGLRSWIETHVAFPNSMVDRITPRTTDEDRERIAAKFGVHDWSPVVTEPFRQWVLEDEFAAERPPWERVDVKMTTDVAPYEKTKMRLLNGGHFCIAYVAALLGFETVAEAVADAQLRELLTQFLAEVRGTLRDLPGIDLEEYAASVVRRFANPAIGDQIARICSDGSAKVTKFILPALVDLLESQAEPRILPLVIASWLRYQLGVAEDGRRYVIADPGVSVLDALVAAGAQSASDALAVRPVFGNVGVWYPELAPSIQNELDNLRTIGVRASLAKALAGVRISQ
jgi:mannitol 2-dehydrogenase